MAIIVLLIICFVVLFALFRISYKMLVKVRKEERAINSNKVPERQLHPKLMKEKQQQQKEKK